VFRIHRGFRQNRRISEAGVIRFDVSKSPYFFCEERPTGPAKPGGLTTRTSHLME